MMTDKSDGWPPIKHLPTDLAPRKRDGSKFSLEESKNIVKKGEQLMGALEDLMPLVYEDGKIVGVQVSEGDSGELIKLGDSLEELTDLMEG